MVVAGCLSKGGGNPAISAQQHDSQEYGEAHQVGRNVDGDIHSVAGKVHIRDQVTGEGGTFPIAELEQAIAAFFSEQF